MNAPAARARDAFERETFAKVSRRLIPFLFILYVVAFLDRVNISYAQLQMSSDLRFSEGTYGLGAGLFFIGYFLFEVPSNVLLERVGARLWIARILIGWGVIASAFVLVRTPTQFYILRFLLGAGEAGFFPGVILFLTYWFPAAFRARTISMFMTGIAVAGVIGGPLSGWIMRDLAGAAGLAGWQWVFLLEGLPAIFCGFLTLAILQNGPQHARWLSEDERRLIVRHLDADRKLRAESGGHQSLRRSLQDVRLWALAAIAFCINLGMYGLNFFLPRLLQEMGATDPLWNGVLSALPFAVGAVAMVLNGRHSDRTLERRWHTAVPAIVAGIGLVIVAAAGTDRAAVAMLGLVLATAGTTSTVSAFWSIPPAFFAAPAAAAGIALLNSLGNLGGFVGPSAVGLAREFLQTNTGALYGLAAAFFVCAALTLAILEPLRRDRPSLVSDEEAWQTPR